MENLITTTTITTFAVLGDPFPGLKIALWLLVTVLQLLYVHVHVCMYVIIRIITVKTAVNEPEADVGQIS